MKEGEIKGPVLYRILLRTNMRGSMTSLFFPPAHEKDWLGADAMYFRIKNLGSVGVRCLIDGEAL